MKYLKSQKGVTIIALVITIVILFIMASIAINEGSNLIDQAKAQTHETNMLSIEAKVKGYAEDIEAIVWTKNDSEKQKEREKKFKEYGLEITTISSEIQNAIPDNYAYEITDEGLKKMSLSDIIGKRYIVIFDKNNYKNMDIVYKEGINYNNTTYYTLSQLKEALQ